MAFDPARIAKFIIECPEFYIKKSIHYRKIFYCYFLMFVWLSIMSDRKSLANEHECVTGQAFKMDWIITTFLIK